MERWVRQRWCAADDAGQRDTREVGVDVDRLVLVAQAVAGDAEPFEFESPCQLERLVRELAHGVGVVAFSLPAIGCEAGEARYVVEKIRHRGDRSCGRTVEADLAGLLGSP